MSLEHLSETARQKLRSMLLADARGAGKLAARIEKKDPTWAAWARRWEVHWLKLANRAAMKEPTP